MASVTIAEIADPLRNLSPWNRLLILHADQHTGHLSFRAHRSVVWEALSSGDAVPFTDHRLAAVSDFATVPHVPLGVDEVRARLGQLVSDDLSLIEEGGASQVYLALGVVARRDPKAAALVDPEAPDLDAVWFAPLMLCPVIVEGLPDAPSLRRVGVPVINPVLRDHLALDLKALPADPLIWTAEDLADYGVEIVAPVATVGLFEMSAYRLWERLNPERDPYLETDPKVRRFLDPRPDAVFPQFEVIDVVTPTMIGPKMDGVQADLIVWSRHGVTMAIQGGPGTGKTHVVAHIIANAMEDGRTVLFMSGRSSAFRALLSRLKGTAFHAGLLPLFGQGCDPRAVAAHYGFEARDTVRATLQQARSGAGAILVTPATYAMHVPASWSFDLLVVDEASLVTLAEVLPAMASAKQLIVCGDLQQMQKDPPFWRLWDLKHPYVPPVTLLEAAITAGVPEARLRHHYRSRHPALIHVANWTYYDALMQVAPTPNTSGISPYRVDQVAGVFDWDACVNAVEAEAVVDALERHIASGSTASVGIITITLQQRDLIRRRIAERGLDLTAIESAESLIVADYNGIQGEERDVILISMTLGPRAGETDWPTSYGAVSLPDGEKRLNVIMTRSRDRMVLFASFPWTSVNQARAQGHSKLGIFMANGHGRYGQMPDDHEGIFGAVLKNVSWEAKDLGNAIGMFDPQTRRFAGAIFVTGLRDPLTERSERAQFENSGWQVFELPNAEFEALEGDAKAQDTLASKLYHEFSQNLIA